MSILYRLLLPSSIIRSFDIELANTEKDQISFMPKIFKQLDRDAYCSAPPLSTTSLRPPRLSREVEARRPRTPLVETKREISSSIESAEFIVDEDFDVKPDVKVELGPRQIRSCGPRNSATISIVVHIRRSGSGGPRPVSVGCQMGGPVPYSRGQPRPSGPTQASRPTKGVQDPAPGGFQPSNAPGARGEG